MKVHQHFEYSQFQIVIDPKILQSNGYGLGVKRVDHFASNARETCIL